MSVDAALSGGMSNRHIHTGLLIFINESPIHLYIKRGEIVEDINFGAEFYAMKAGVEMVEALCYKLQMFGISIDGSSNVFCDHEVIYNNTITPESILNKKHHSIAYHRCTESVDYMTTRVAKQRTEKNLSNMFTNNMTTSGRRFLLEKFTY